MQAQLELFSAEHPDVRPETAEFLTLLREQTERLIQMTRTLLEMSNLRQAARDWDFLWRSPISTAAPFGWEKSSDKGTTIAVELAGRDRKRSLRRGYPIAPLGGFADDRFSTSATLSQQLSISSLSWVITRMVLPFRSSLFSLSAIRRIFCPSRPLVGSSRINILRPEKDGAGDGKALLLPAGQGGRMRIPVLVNPKFFQQISGTVFVFIRQSGIQQQSLCHACREELR